MNDVQAYNNAQQDEDKAMCDLLLDQIVKGLPEAQAKVWHGSPVWFIEGNPIVGYGKLKGCVRLLFWSGQSFTAKGLVPEGSFKAAEVRYTSYDQIHADAIQQWLQESANVQWDYKNIVKRRGVLERL